jgi:hypothetical protein
MRALLITLACAACTSLSEDQVLFDRVPDASVADAIALGPTLRSINENILRPQCQQRCHLGDGPAGNMNLTTDPYGVLVNQIASGKQCAGTGWVRVVPNDIDHSLLYQKVLAKVQGLPAAVCGDPMPQTTKFPPITQAQLDAIKGWILAGAPPEPPR